MRKSNYCPLSRTERDIYRVHQKSIKKIFRIPTTVGFLINGFSIGLLFIGIMISSCSTNSTPAAPATVEFKKVVLHDTFLSEAVAAGDFNDDGHMDVIAGALWFEGPHWTKKHEVFEPQEFDPAKGYSNSFLNYAQDLNGDGLQDLILFDFPGRGVYWYENSGDTASHWTKHLIDTSASNESPMFVDLDEDGKKELVFGRKSTKEMMWYEWTKTGDSVVWQGRALSVPGSPGTDQFSHGLGFDDVNNDGRKDVIVREGWWEAPEDRRKLPWAFHPQPLGLPCSQMHAYDFDGDGDNDVISASAHNFGIWWHENLSNTGQDTFTTHLIDSTFSETHATAHFDVNYDGLPDLVTGKRWFAHMGRDPGGMDPAVLYWLELQRGEDNKPTWVKHLIDDNSGVGIQTVIEDMDGNGTLDILNSSKKGVILFLRVEGRG